jgi:hypothetical protein
MQVLLDLTVHQEQIISLFHHQILMSARQRLLQQQQQQLGAEAATITALAATAAAAAADGQQSTPLEPQQQLQRLHQQLLQQVEQVQQQQGLQETLQTSCSWSADAVAEAMEEDVDPQQALEGQQQRLQQQDVDATSLGIKAEDSSEQQHLQHLQQQQSHPASCSYVGSLLQAAATDEAEQQRVLAMTAPDWSKFFTESFYKLLLLLELADRNEEFLQADQPQPQQQQQRQQQCAGLGAAAGTAAAAGVDIHSVSHMQQLEHLVDEWVMLSALSLILNPLPVYVACTINHATQQPCAAPGVSALRFGSNRLGYVATGLSVCLRHSKHVLCTINHAAQQPCAAPGVSAVFRTSLRNPGSFVSSRSACCVHHQPRHAAALRRTGGDRPGFETTKFAG